MKFSAKDVHVIEAYLKLAASEGMATLTLQKIAKAAKISYGKAQYYFGGTSEFLMQGMVDYVGRGAQQFIYDYVEGAADQTPKVKSYVAGTFRWKEERPHHAVFWLYYYYLSSVKGHFRKKHPEYLNLARRRVYDYICQDIGAGLYAPICDGEAKAAAIHSCLVGNVLLSTTDSKERLPFYRDQVLRMVDDTLRRASQ